MILLCELFWAFAWLAFNDVLIDVNDTEDICAWLDWPDWLICCCCCCFIWACGLRLINVSTDGAVLVVACLFCWLSPSADAIVVGFVVRWPVERPYIN